MLSDTYIIKIKHILPTLLTITIGSVIGLAIIRWLFCIQFTIININEEIWEIWIPLIFPWIPITLWLRQRLRILNFNKEEDRRRSMFQVITWFMMAGMLITSQCYLTTATGKLQTLTNINEIHHKEKERYYKINSFFVPKNAASVYVDFSTSNSSKYKSNDRLNFGVYFVAPILKDKEETIKTSHKYWYAFEYHDQIDNNLSDQQKNNLFKLFYESCLREMNEYDFHTMDYFERMPTSSKKVMYDKAIENGIGKPVDDSFVILKPVFEPYENRNGNNFTWIFGIFGIGLTLFLLLLTWPTFSKQQYDNFLKGKKPKNDDVIDMLKYLIPKGDHFITSILIDLNILVFLAMLISGINPISPNASELLEWGGNRRYDTLNEWWRLVTSIFLHGGLIHIISNIAALVIAAIYIEPKFSRSKYALLYLFSGLCGSIASVIWHENTVSVGASGAIFGLFGAILILLFTNAYEKFEKRIILIIIGTYVAINLLIGLTGNIDNAAHIGGLISGALIGLLLYKTSNKNKNSFSSF